MIRAPTAIAGFACETGIEPPERVVHDLLPAGAGLRAIAIAVEFVAVPQVGGDDFEIQQTAGKNLWKGLTEACRSDLCLNRFRDADVYPAESSSAYRSI